MLKNVPSTIPRLANSNLSWLGGGSEILHATSHKAAGVASSAGLDQQVPNAPIEDSKTDPR